jgi:cellulose 1,4-beta-cellobiosidase
MKTHSNGFTKTHRFLRTRSHARHLATWTVGLSIGCASAASQAPTANAPPTNAPPTPPTPLATPTRTVENPFDGARLFVNRDYTTEIEHAAAASKTDAAKIRKVGTFPTAIWLNSIETAGTAGRYLDEAAAQQAATPGQPVLVLFVLYNMPNRDCAANSSAGELSVEHDGEQKYRTEFIDRIAAQFKSHPSVRIAAVVEPDSLANIATNLDHEKCKASQAAYRHSIAYGIRQLSLPNVWLYLDAAHAGWLGWPHNRDKIAKIFAEVFAEAGGEGGVRGFATNVSNYNSLNGGEGAKLEPSDPCPDELTYVGRLAASLGVAGVHAKSFVIDTSRNGQNGMRTKWGNWCNVHGAGLGERPRASPAPGVDAYYWIKPPGESDGTSDPGAPRYDAACSSPDSAPNAPQAGVFFPTYFADLVAKANPPL